MARPKDPPKPLYPIKHEFVATLDNFIHEAGMLVDAVSMALDNDVIRGETAKSILAERVAAFRAARGD